jgi:uncharacterized protein (TIGR00369 family)
MTTQDKFLEAMLELKTKMGKVGEKLTIPPPSMLTLKHNYTHFVAGQSLVAEVPFNKEFVNPVGYFQGGFLAAAIDDVFGPLSYLSAEAPCVSLDFNVKFIRPFVSEHQKIEIEATVIAKTKSLITMEAKIKTMEGKILAIANMNSMILPIT